MRLSHKHRRERREAFKQGRRLTSQRRWRRAQARLAKHARLRRVVLRAPRYPGARKQRRRRSPGRFATIVTVFLDGKVCRPMGS